MTICSIEERKAGRPYPRTCPTCRLDGSTRGHDYKTMRARIADLEAQLEAEIAVLRDALQDGVDLIAGDAVGAEWKRRCLDFLSKARAALSKGEQK